MAFSLLKSLFHITLITLLGEILKAYLRPIYRCFGGKAGFSGGNELHFLIGIVSLEFLRSCDKLNT